MKDIPQYAAAVWFDTYVRPRLGGEKSIERKAEGLFSRYHTGLFEDLCSLEQEFDLQDRKVETGIMYIIIDSVLKYGRPVSNRYCGREVSEQELENIELEKHVPRTKEEPDGALGVG